jgi:hypothetical protein
MGVERKVKLASRDCFLLSYDQKLEVVEKTGRGVIWVELGTVNCAIKSQILSTGVQFELFLLSGFLRLLSNLFCN